MLFELNENEISAVNGAGDGTFFAEKANAALQRVVGQVLTKGCQNVPHGIQMIQEIDAGKLTAILNPEVPVPVSECAW